MSKYDAWGCEVQNPILIPGEQILWQGKPKKNAFILNKVLTMLPIAIIWLGFDSMIFGAFSSAGSMGGILLLFLIFHLMPVWIWLYNALTAAKKWENTMYYVTDRRIIIQTGFLDAELQSVYYKEIRDVNLRIGLIDKLLGVGDIYFDLGTYYHNGKTRVNRRSFLDIAQPHQVYTRVQKIILDMQADIEFPNAYRPEENPGYNTRYRG